MTFTLEFWYLLSVHILWYIWKLYTILNVRFSPVEHNFHLQQTPQRQLLTNILECILNLQKLIFYSKKLCYNRFNANFPEILKIFIYN